jgi:periplasmic protein CpxP/Spy
MEAMLHHINQNKSIMKKIILSLFAILFAIGAFAQKGPKTEKTLEEMATKRADKLKTELSLTDEQRTKVYQAHFDKMTKMKAIKAKNLEDKKAIAKEMKPVNDSFQANMKSILTTDQFTQWEVAKKNEQATRKEKRKERAKKSELSAEEMANKKADKLKSELTLTDEQRTKVYQAQLEKITQMKAIKAKNLEDKKAKAKEVKPVNEAFQAKMKTILTPEQLTKWEEMKKNQKEKGKEFRKGKSDKKGKQ